MQRGKSRSENHGHFSTVRMMKEALDWRYVLALDFIGFGIPLFGVVGA